MYLAKNYKKKFTSFSIKEKDNIFRKSKKLVSNDFFDLKRTIEKTEENKFLMVISKKVGNSPYRNYLRRCCKEIFRKINFSSFYHYVIIFKINKKEKIKFKILENFLKEFIL